LVAGRRRRDTIPNLTRTTSYGRSLRVWIFYDSKNRAEQSRQNNNSRFMELM
jgi:hypothetical protein